MTTKTEEQAQNTNTPVQFKAEIARTGVYRGYGGDATSKFSITKDTLLSFVKNFSDRLVSNELPVYVGHGTPENFEGTEPPAIGWIVSLSIQENKPLPVLGKTYSLLADIKMDQQNFSRYIEKGTFQFTSIEAILGDGIIHPILGGNTGAILTGLALTNQPFIRGMKKLMNASLLSTRTSEWKQAGNVLFCSFSLSSLTTQNTTQDNMSSPTDNLNSTVIPSSTLSSSSTEENPSVEDKVVVFPLKLSTAEDLAALSPDEQEKALMLLVKEKEEELAEAGSQEKEEEAAVSSVSEVEAAITTEEETPATEEEAAVEPSIEVEILEPEEKEEILVEDASSTTPSPEQEAELLGLITDLAAKLGHGGESAMVSDVSSAIKLLKKVIEQDQTALSLALSRAKAAEELVESGKTLNARALVSLAVNSGLLPQNKVEWAMELFASDKTTFTKEFTILFSNKTDKALREKAVEEKYLSNLTGKANRSSLVSLSDKASHPAKGVMNEVVTPSLRTGAALSTGQPATSSNWEAKYLSRISPSKTRK